MNNLTIESSRQNDEIEESKINQNENTDIASESDMSHVDEVLKAKGHMLINLAKTDSKNSTEDNTSRQCQDITL